MPGGLRTGQTLRKIQKAPASLATLISQPVVIASARIPKSFADSSRAAATAYGQRDELAETVREGLVGDQR
jgi:hypothetical protein